MRKKNIFSIVIVAVTAVVAIAATAAHTTKSGVSDLDSALAVNGEPVAAGEFRMQLSYLHVAKTYSYFKEKHGVNPGQHFWTTSYGGEIPIVYAREKTLQDEVRIKVQQGLMKENGIAGDIGYEAFLASLEAENQQRQEAVKEGKVIYGPEQFGANEYFDYQFGNNVFKLKEKLFAEKSTGSDEELKKQYESDMDKLYRLPDAMKLAKITIPFGNDESGQANAEQLVMKAKRLLDDGAAFGEVAAQFNRDGKAEEQIMDETTAKNDDYLYPELKTVAANMKAGQISGPIETKDGYVIVQCIGKTKNRYLSYAEVKDKVRASYIDAQYEALIDKLAGEARVEINQEVYDKIFP